MIYLINLKTSEGAHNLLMFDSNEYSVMNPATGQMFGILRSLQQPSFESNGTETASSLLIKVLVHAFSAFLCSVVALMICW